MGAQVQPIGTDQPLNLPEEDTLARWPLMRALARAIVASSPDQSVVVGIHGPWGDGKTTALNFLRRSLLEHPQTLPIDFNPWRFVDESAMLRAFLAAIARAADARIQKRREKILTRMAEYGELIAPVDTRVAAAQKLAKRFGAVDMETIRGRLVASLRGTDKRIVVLVDDIDRLTKTEMRTLFRLIKACADFPNVTYVLAFDDNLVAEALGGDFGESGSASGRAFLEKIIQMPLRLPAARREDLRQLCFTRVDQAIRSAEINLSEQNAGAFAWAFERGAVMRLRTPRHVNLYANAIGFALPVLKDETHPVDVLLIEALRICYPEVYEVVRHHYNEFAGIQSSSGHGSADKSALERLGPILAPMPEEEVKGLQSLLMTLFPRLSAQFGNVFHGVDSLPLWSEQKRICHPSYCARYFVYGLPHDDVSDALVDGMIIALQQSASDARTTLQTILKPTTAARAIEQLRRRANTLEESSARNLARMIAEIGHTLPNPPEMFPFGYPMAQSAMLIADLVGCLKAADRLPLALELVECAGESWFAEECLRWLHVTEEPGKKDENVLTDSEAKQYEAAVASRAKREAEAGADLVDLQHREKFRLLFAWARTRGRPEVQDYLLELFLQKPTKVNELLILIAPQAWVSGLFTVQVGEIDHSQLEFLERIIDLVILAKAVRANCPGQFDSATKPSGKRPPEQRVAEDFMWAFRHRNKADAAKVDKPDRDKGNV